MCRTEVEVGVGNCHLDVVHAAPCCSILVLAGTLEMCQSSELEAGGRSGRRWEISCRAFHYGS